MGQNRDPAKLTTVKASPMSKQKNLFTQRKIKTVLAVYVLNSIAGLGFFPSPLISSFIVPIQTSDSSAYPAPQPVPEQRHFALLLLYEQQQQKGQ